MPREKTVTNKTDQERSLKVRRVEVMYKGRRSDY